MEIRYPTFLEPQPGRGFFVHFPDFNDIFTEGDTEEEALFNAAEVLTGMLEAKIEDGDHIPAPSAAEPGAHMIAPDVKAQAALLIRFTHGDHPFTDARLRVEFDDDENR